MPSICYRVAANNFRFIEEFYFYVCFAAKKSEKVQ